MRKIRQVLRLTHELGLSERAIARSLEISRDVIHVYITRAATAGITWPLAPEIDDAQLESQLYPSSALAIARKVEPDWALIHQELKRKGATMQALHAEYIDKHPNGIGYSLFCQRYRKWKRSLRRYMRQTHTAGEKAFVDYAGPTMAITNIQTGEVRRAQIFVGILGASNYTYAEAHWTQRQPDWIAAHTRMFEYFGGVPEIVVCDNLKSAVTKPSRTEPQINATYQHLAEHYGTTIFPARPYKPKDKAKVENAVRVVERWILFRLRKRLFTTLAELNDAMRTLLEELNYRPFQKMTGSRRSQYEAIDLPALKPLPLDRFNYTEFRKVTVGMDGRFEVDGRPYSAPHYLSRKPIELIITTNTIEIVHKNQRVASHIRGSGTTPCINPEHLAPNDRYFGMWNAEGELQWASTVGLKTHAFLQGLLASKKAKIEGYRGAQSIKSLAKEFGAERLEASCARALEIGAHTVRSVRDILRAGLDKQRRPNDDVQEAAFHHQNVRGSDYYH